jgi:hydrogenase maturation protease
MLLIAIGNPWRRDDGAAVAAAALVEDCCRTLAVRELTPELAAEIAGETTVVFVDADVRPGEVEIRKMAGDACLAPAPLTHSLGPEAVLALARALYGFEGSAWECAIPGEDFGEGEGLSAAAALHVERAAEMLRGLAAGAVS